MKPTIRNNTTWYSKHAAAFGLCWIVVFILYYPAAQAGRVGDFPGWVKNVSTMKFWDYVNRTESHIPSLYHFTQIVTWCFYQLFGVNAWAWHILYVTMQAMNAWLLFRLCSRMFADAGITNGHVISLGGALLFCICPHISEVVVWEPSFHYLLGLLFILLILLCAQKYAHTHDSRYAWYAALLFFLSTWSLEIFYLTPLLVFTLLLYYSFMGGFNKRLFTGALMRFIAPQIIFFGLHLALVNVVYHSGVGHIGTNTMQLSVENLSKPVKYIFHILFFGRYFNDDLRQRIYRLCESRWVLSAFYFVALSVLAIIVTRYKKMKSRNRAASSVFIWVVLSIGLISLVWFPFYFVVIYDRYTYVTDAFIYTLFALLLSYISLKVVAMGVYVLFALVNLYFTHKVNKLWKVSGDEVNKLVASFPNDASKTVLILNVPECYYGVQMIGSREEGEFAIMYNALMPQKLTNTVYEVSAFNITSPTDGAHVNVINDSVVHVTLNQWGTWWWWFGFGAINYENSYYKLNMVDGGHWYELILKQPASNYLLLYTVGDQWKKVDMSLKNADQN